MGKLINDILYPKISGLRGTEKSVVFIVHSSADEENASVNYNSTVQYLEGRGYGMLNKERVVHPMPDEKLLKKAIRTGVQNAKHGAVTLWFEAHGAPSWLFGESKSVSSELKGSVDFACFVRQFEREIGCTVEHIVLSGCFTATELMNEYRTNYFNSSARMLSILLPDKNVLGFVGEHAGSKVTHLFEKLKNGEFKRIIVSPENAAVVFRNGTAIESYNGHYYCNHLYTPDFILDKCDFEVDVNNKANLFYKPALVREALATANIFMNRDVYGEQQINVATQISESLGSKAKEAFLLQK